MKKLLYSFLLTLVTISCSKERLGQPIQQTPEPTQPNVAPNILEEFKENPQTFTISDDRDMPIIGKYGSILFLYSSYLETQNGDEVNYPFDVEFVEVLTPKDFILNNLPTVSNGRLLETAGSFYVNASKNGEQLKANNMRIIRQANNPDDQMSLFSLDSINAISSWNTLLTQEPLVVIRSDTTNQRDIIQSYHSFPPGFGWWNIDRFLSSDEETTEISVKLVSPTSFEEINAYLFFYNRNSIMRIFEEKTFPVPVGSKVRLLAFSRTNDGDLFADFQDYTLEAGQTIEIDVQPVSEADIQKELDELAFRTEL